MLTLLQRVSHASVTIDSEIIASINQGLLILCGFEKDDVLSTAEKLLTKCLKYRVFSDQGDKMNLSVTDIQGEVLIVPQFTLVADTKRGLRPNFSKGMPPDKGKILFKELQQSAINLYKNSSFGTFGADMNINLFNDGPVTFLLSSH